MSDAEDLANELFPVPVKAAAPVDPTRDSGGLTVQERKLLQEIALVGDYKKAAQNVGMTAAQVRRLLATDPAFKDEYDAMFPAELIKSTEAELQVAAQDIAEVFNEAKNAQIWKSTTAECPQCHAKFPVRIQVADHSIRMRAAETLAKITKLWKDQKTVTHEGTVSLVSMSAEQYLAYMAVLQGRRIPDHVYKGLQEFDRDGKLNLPPNGGGRPVEGQYRVIPEEEANAPDTPTE